MIAIRATPLGAQIRRMARADHIVVERHLVQPMHPVEDGSPEAASDPDARYYSSAG